MDSWNQKIEMYYAVVAWPTVSTACAGSQNFGPLTGYEQKKCALEKRKHQLSFFVKQFKSSSEEQKWKAIITADRNSPQATAGSLSTPSIIN